MLYRARHAVGRAAVGAGLKRPDRKASRSVFGLVGSVSGIPPGPRNGGHRVCPEKGPIGSVRPDRWGANRSDDHIAGTGGSGPYRRTGTPGSSLRPPRTTGVW